MASKYHGEFQVSADFVETYLYDSPNLLGSWLVVGELRDHNYPCVYTVDNTRDEALETLRWCVCSDHRITGLEHDYEIWHVVDSPDWLNVPSFDSIALVEHHRRAQFDETMVYLKGSDFPYGLAVLVTPWAYYTVSDWQGQQPVSIRDLNNFECVETCAALLPSSHIDAFVDFCENMVNDIELLRWNDLRGFELRLHRLDNLI